MTITQTETTRETLLEQNLDYTLFSWAPQGNLNPIAVDKTDGVYVYDKNGKRYIDFSSQLMNVNCGHNHPKINQAIKDQLDKVSFVFPGMATEPRGELGKKLAEISPGNLKKTFLQMAVQMQLKMRLKQHEFILENKKLSQNIVRIMVQLMGLFLQVETHENYL